MNCAMTVLYEPKENEIKNMRSYCDCVDWLFVLDNSKQDNMNTVSEALSDSTSHITYKHFEENIGLCRALNYGMEKAKELGCKWSLIMDADSSFITDIIGVYMDYLKRNTANEESIAVLAPVHIFDRSKNHGYEGSREIKWAMTSGCFYNVDIFGQLGGFKEELFVDGLDMDYCYKATGGV